MWIARDRNGNLLAYSARPVKDNTLGSWRSVCAFDKDGNFVGNEDKEIGWLQLDNSEFPEVTWETSPVEIKITSVGSAGQTDLTLVQQNNHVQNLVQQSDNAGNTELALPKSKPDDNSWVYKSLMEDDMCADCEFPVSDPTACDRCPIGDLKCGMSAEEVYEKQKMQQEQDRRMKEERAMLNLLKTNAKREEEKRRQLETARDTGDTEEFTIE